MLTRRNLLTRAAALLATGSPALRGLAQLALPVLKLTAEPAIPIPANFIGLGYEMSSVAPIGLLSPANTVYVQLLRNLAPAGVLRVGGIVADYTTYIPTGTPLAEKQNTVITQASLRQFAQFLQLTGWSAIWSINFAQGTIAQAIEEARAVHQTLGSRLLALELGNEVNAYGRGQHPFRTPPYDYETYRKEYDTWRAAILAAVPGLPFAAPDSAASPDWVERMAADAAAKKDVQLLALHYYRNGQQRGSADQLLTPDPTLASNLARMRIASQQSRLPWRMCETNSFSGGGRPGVSDTFVGALWTLDYMLLLAAAGCSGINLETGVNQLGFVSSYSPIQQAPAKTDGEFHNTAGVPYYGMLAFAHAFAGCTHLLPTQLDASVPGLTAYILGTATTPRSAAFINKHPTQPAQLSLLALNFHKASVTRLQAPAPESETGITFAGATVSSQGVWRPIQTEPLKSQRLTIPPMSAAVLRT